jgi:hypothetical protein
VEQQQKRPVELQQPHQHQQQKRQRTGSGGRPWSISSHFNNSNNNYFTSLYENHYRNSHDKNHYSTMRTGLKTSLIGKSNSFSSSNNYIRSNN